MAHIFRILNLNQGATNALDLGIYDAAFVPISLPMNISNIS